jgi:hypothetical protein
MNNVGLLSFVLPALIPSAWVSLELNDSSPNP